MTLRAALLRVLQQEDLNFLLTNRIPRRWLTQWVGWLSRIEQPWLSRLAIAAMRLFTDVDLSEARERRFPSLGAFFTRELRPGARPIDRSPAVLVSPSDGIVGACGEVVDGQALQIKGFPYPLVELLGDAELARYYAGGRYATLRLTAGMYHRFHAPQDCEVRQVTYVSGDTWNVNPIALKRIERLFCKNERAIIRCALASSGQLLTLVPVAAILVASIRLRFLDLPLNRRYRGPQVIPCAARFGKGEELGWFEHGSTIVAVAPRGFAPAAGLIEGARIRMGEPLLLAPRPPAAASARGAGAAEQ
jgi:phosphatidylserine decarboxylase